MAWVDELRAVMPPAPDGRAPVQDWAAIEAAVGVPMPPAYKTFCEVWGPGGLLAGEIIFLAASVPGRRETVAFEAEELERAYADMRRDQPETYALPPLPRPGSLLPFGIDGNGNSYGWIVGAGDPDAWQVAILADGDGMPEPTGLDFPSFMLALARHALRSGVLHPNLLARPMTFEPLMPEGAVGE